MPATPESPRVALVAGATGLIGSALWPRLLNSARYAQVHLLLRRAVPGMVGTNTLQLHQVDFAHLPDPLPAVDDVYICLGTTIAVAGSQSAFRAIDFDAVLATARAARNAGATRLAVVSSAGADPGSFVFYSRVKGEMEQAVSQLGYACVTLAQPSLLMGDRPKLGQRTRPAEVWAQRLLGPVSAVIPKSVRPIHADKVACALMRATLAGAPGVHRLSSAQMQSEVVTP